MVVHLPGLFEEAEKNEKKGRSVSRQSRSTWACWPCSHRKPESKQAVQGPQNLASGHSLDVTGELS